MGWLSVLCWGAGALRCDPREVLLLPFMSLNCLAESEVDRMTREFWLEQKHP